MVACPRCGRVDDGTSYQCPDCFTVLQPELAAKRSQPSSAPSAPGTPPPDAAPGTPPPGAAAGGPPPGAPYAPPPGTPYAPPPGSPYPPPPGANPSAYNPYNPPAQQAYMPYAAPRRPYGMPDVPTYLVHAILCTLFCCLPFGIVAIVYAAKVSSLQGMGDWDGAMAASDSARMWCWISFGLGLVFSVIYFIFVFAAASHQPPRY